MERKLCNQSHSSTVNCKPSPPTALFYHKQFYKFFGVEHGGFWLKQSDFHKMYCKNTFLCKNSCYVFTLYVFLMRLLVLFYFNTDHLKPPLVNIKSELRL